MVAIKCDDLRYEFVESKGTKRHVALNGLSLTVEPGTIYGLLGPNGAGKTTTVKILTTLMVPSGGRAMIFGNDVVQRAKEVRSNVGVAFGGDKGFFPRLTGRQNLQYFSLLQNLAPSLASQRIGMLLDRMHLTDRADSRVATYSAGMKQRLHLARAMLADPLVVFLDEPTVGLDPAVALDLREEVKRWKDAGKTIFLTTHYMLEADELCDNIGIIFKGRIVADGPPTAIKKGFGRLKVIECAVRTFEPELTAALMASPLITDVELVERASFPCFKIFSEEEIDVEDCVRTILQDRMIGDMLVRQQTLEEAYLSIVRLHGQSKS
jgi:ABC-2 type transport system ATP-binding protein